VRMKGGTEFRANSVKWVSLYRWQKRLKKVFS